MVKLYLASTSPRRRFLLENLGLKIEVIEPLWESKVLSEDPGEMVELTALEKARSVMGWVDEGVVIAADTIIVTEDGEFLGKPKDAGEAKKQLKKLSGKWHTVYTGIALIKLPERIEKTAHSLTRVKFKELSEEEIDCYIRSREPMDKAGSYGIQGLASLFVEKIEGDYFTVVGFPLSLFYKLLMDLNINLLLEIVKRC